MPNKIKVIPLAEESFGVRSMCTYIETSDAKILLDAGASLAPKRLGYPPHPREYQALAECRKRIDKTAEKVEVITISHYHFDHHTPSYTDWFTNWSSPETAQKIYEEKLVLAKSYRSKVNASQRRRGWMFKKTGGSYAKKLETADGRTFTFGETKLKFSEPVFHGPENSELGWVLMATVEVGDKKVVFASDVQGPIHAPTLDKILAEKPELVLVGGPPTYLAGFRVKEEDIEQGMWNLKRLVENVPTTILEHHTFRDENWKSLSQNVFDAATEVGHKVLTAAEFLGKENNFLEFRRRQLFEAEPPSIEYEKWIKLLLQKRKLSKPPI
ncbi:MBL fold metallo-hydrolase [Candidatus Bathyarchaeota archaeon]|nr:MBL fold metallo-hydrolase [Candidatus Bathyarchaeota archaeon]